MVQRLKPLGIIAGKGLLPEYIIQECLASGRDVVAVVLKDEKEVPPSLSEIPSKRVSFGEIGAIIRFFKEHKVHDMVMAGAMRRPSLTRIKPDLKGAKLLAQLLSKKALGDDVLLSTVATFFEKEKFSVIGAHEVLSHLLVRATCYSKTKPNRHDNKDITVGQDVAGALGVLDVGQAVIVQHGVVLGVEAIEGTDQLIKRCADYRFSGDGGVLIKRKKPQQDRRLDLPTIGVETIRQLKHAGFKGVAIEAGAAFILDENAVIDLANKYKMFVVGI